MDLKKKNLTLTLVIRDFALVTSPDGKFDIRKIRHDDRTIGPADPPPSSEGLQIIM